MYGCLIERQRNVADERRPVRRRHGDLVLVGVDVLNRLEPAQGLLRLFRLDDVRDDDVGADGTLQLLRRPFRRKQPVIDDADALRQFVSLFQVLRRQEDGDALLPIDRPDIIPNLGAADGVEAGGRFVQEQHLWVVDERRSEIEAALHPAGVGANETFQRIADVDERLQFGDSLIGLLARQPIEGPLQSQQLQPRLLRVEANVLQRSADAQPNLESISNDIETGDGSRAARR